jgi:exodeoxyribonuclease V alpha subunit
MMSYLDGKMFSVLDCHFTRFITQIFGEERKEALLAAALASWSASEGNICLDLRTLAGKPPAGISDDFLFPSPDEWLKILKKSPAVGVPGDFKPLILDGRGRLYLYRYWEYEKKLADFISEKVKGNDNAGKGAEEYDLSLFKEKLNLFFPTNVAGDFDWRKIASAISLLKGFSVISGSPGTGKTTAATRIIALLLELTPHRKLSIALTAPTGKAAAKLQEAVKKAREALPCSEAVKAAIPEKATTIHRLLKSKPYSPYFHHNQENHLPSDVVIVDEASMVDLPLMVKLVQAMPAAAKLILLGDKDQLTSVEAGAVMGDICGYTSPDIFSQDFIRLLEVMTGDNLKENLFSGGSSMNDCVVQLKKNYRFGEKSGIGQVSAAVNRGDAQSAIYLLNSGDFDDVSWCEPRYDRILPFLKDRVVGGFRDYSRALVAGDPEEVFALFDSFRILCALRHGPLGVHAINAMVEQLLKEEGLISPGRRWYPGLPIMITKNDYQQKLFNGDVGVILHDPEEGDELSAFFQDASGTIRKISPLRLPEHETVYAMTVHKSQGSEFGRVLFILPDRDVPLLTRELIYTGITRARNFVEIWSRKEIFREAVLRRVGRASGLGDALWGAGIAGC